MAGVCRESVLIPIKLAAEPSTFDSKVRQPGLNWLKKNQAKANLGHYKHYWTDILPELMVAYSQICAFTCVSIHWDTGARSVDHMLPKSKAQSLAYEWSNYRLACQAVNAKKKDLTGLLDPFEIEPDWFQMDLVGFQVVVNPGLPRNLQQEIGNTIKGLGLNAKRFRDGREIRVQHYLDKEVTFAHLQKTAPFLAIELKRQGKLLAQDT